MPPKLSSERGLRFHKRRRSSRRLWGAFCAAGLIDPKFHRWLLDAFDKRLQGDHGAEAVVTAEDAQTIIEQAGEFLEAANGFLGVQP